MTDIKKVIDNPETFSPRQASRKLDLQDWDETQGKRIAEQQGIELAEAHWEVVDYLRDYYLEYGFASSGRVVSDTLDSRFADQGGRKYLRRLFPEGPVAQGMCIAGLPLPPHTENEGLASAADRRLLLCSVR